MQEISTKPYLVRALFEWCNDSGYTPYLTVTVGEAVQVPLEYVREGQIVLNISPLATNRLVIGNEFLEFQARFGGVARDVRVPMEAIAAIYARETGSGMAFEAASAATTAGTAAPAPQPAPAPPAVPGPQVLAPVTVLRSVPPAAAEEGPEQPPPGPGPGGERPRLTRVK